MRGGMTDADAHRCSRSQGADGTGRGAAKLAQLRDNSNFVRDALRNMGCEVLGDRDSPVRFCGAAIRVAALWLTPVARQVMPVMLYNPGKIPAFSREVQCSRLLCARCLHTHD